MRYFKDMSKKNLSGWSNILKSKPKLVLDARDILNRDFIKAEPRAVRGLGKAYGDAATLNGGLVLQTSSLDKILFIDKDTGICKVESGVKFEDLLKESMKIGWTPAVVPGSRTITLGGALAFDIHGKNHFIEGSFSNTIQEFELLGPNGKREIINRENNSELFKFTVGGMGLSGIVLNLTIQLKKIAGNALESKLYRTTSFSETARVLWECQRLNEYVIAWIDLLHPKQFGRAIITTSNFRASEKVEGFNEPPKLITIPKIPFNLVVKPLIKNFNNYRYLKLSKRTNEMLLHSCWEILFPSDLFHKWNRLFGKSGLMEYQFVFPKEKLQEAERLISEICSATVPSLCAMKILGEGNDNLMSFPQEGLLIGITFPWKSKLLPELAKWDEELVRIGGKKYLAKDVYTSQKIIKKMYPQLSEFIEYKSKYDPNEIYTSDLWSRISKSPTHSG
jgi:decaprenylphospho-beta-D-ribofuranose 2-oxidase